MRLLLFIAVVGLASPTWAVDPDGGTPRPAAGQADTPVPAAKPAPKGPPPVAKLECAPNPVRIGETLLCSLSIVHRQDVSVTVSAPEGVIPEPVTAAEPHLKDMLKTTRAFRVQARSMKKVRVEGMTVVWTEVTGGQGELAIPTLKIPVKSVMTGVKDPALRTFEAPGGDSEAFWTLHGPVPYRVTNWPLIIVLLVILGAAIGLGLGVWIKRLLDARGVEVDPGILPEEAHLEAARELAALDAEALPSQGRFEEYFVRLSEILRRYLKNRYRIQGLEWTSEEIREWFRESGHNDAAQALLNQFLEETDLVKFANVQATADAVGITTGLAEQFIEQTKLIVEAAPSTPTEAAPSTPTEGGAA